jgi:GNAT superfamily N-acetyltransferase
MRLELGLSAADFRELAQLAGIVYYGAPPRDEATACLAGLVDLGRSMVIRDGDEMVGGAATCHLELTVPGGRQVPAAGLTEIAVLPTHRRRGLLREMVAAHAQDARAHGELVSLLSTIGAWVIPPATSLSIVPAGPSGCFTDRAPRRHHANSTVRHRHLPGTPRGTAAPSARRWTPPS